MCKWFSLFRRHYPPQYFSLHQIITMSSKAPLHNSMRVYHRYLGFFLAGIMAVYALSGIVLIFRDTSFLKKEKQLTQQLQPGLTAEALGKAIRIRDLKITSVSGDVQMFKQGTYNAQTGSASCTVTVLPVLVEKLTHLHKASTKDPLFFLNVFFGVSLFFFVISSFWMFMPKTSIFKKGLYFTLAGIVLTVVLLMV
nr:PepSY domain-containing protein [Ferruginibacter sp.]